VTLGSGRMEADFHCRGTVEVEIDRLKRRVRG